MKGFIRSVGVVLILTAIAKLVAGFGSAHVLLLDDPLFGVSFRSLLLFAALLEIVVAAICFLGNDTGKQSAVVAWLATEFLLYRIGLHLVGYHKPCSCLGNITDALYISPKSADMVMKFILAYLLFGSYLGLYWQSQHLTSKMVQP